MGLKSKLLLLCICLLSFTLLCGGISYWGILKLDSGLNNISKLSLPKIQQADTLYLHFAKTRIALRTLGLNNITNAEAKRSIDTVMNEIKSYEETAANYRKMNFLTGEEAIYSEVEKNWITLKNIGVKVLDIYNKKENDYLNKIQYIFLNDCEVAAQNFNNSIAKLVNFHEQNADLWTKTAHNDSQLVNTIQFSIVILSTILSILIGYLFSKNISNLISGISKNISNGSDKIQSYTNEISIISNSLQDNISKQASSLQETTVTIEQTNAGLNSSLENVRKAFQVSNLGQNCARNGKSFMNDALNAMAKISKSIVEIKSEIDRNNKEISSIVDVIAEISTKTKIINEIVFQTKLLSFNASVEAARAGEHGRGFSVVAEEIGNLAKMSGDSAQEITVMIDSSIKKVEATVESSKKRITGLVVDSNEIVKQGNLTISECNVNLDEIINHIDQLNALMSDISRSTDEQSQSMNEINIAMAMIDTASVNNSTSSQKANLTVASLESQLSDFRKIIVNLNSIVDGKKSA